MRAQDIPRPCIASITELSPHLWWLSPARNGSSSRQPFCPPGSHHLLVEYYGDNNNSNNSVPLVLDAFVVQNLTTPPIPSKRCRIVRRDDRWCRHWFRGRSCTHLIHSHSVHQRVWKGRWARVRTAQNLRRRFRRKNAGVQSRIRFGHKFKSNQGIIPYEFCRPPEPSLNPNQNIIVRLIVADFGLYVVHWLSLLPIPWGLENPTLTASDHAMAITNL